jgi:hypothetical protein
VQQMLARVASAPAVKYDKKLNEELVKIAQKQRELLKRLCTTSLSNR